VNFSEWSTVLVLKTLTGKISIDLKGSVDTNLTDRYETSLTPTFTGTFSYNKTGEFIIKHKFDLYKENKLIDSSNWIVKNTAINTY